MNELGIETTALILQARDGCGSSLGMLLDGYRAYLLRMTTRRIAPELRACLAPSDIVQGTLLIAARDFPQFRGDTEVELRAWLLRIVTSQLVDGLRRFVNTEKRRSDRFVRRGDSALIQTAENGETPSRLASLNEQAALLVESIESLPHELREVVESRYLEDLTFPEIAARMALPVTTCRRRWLEAVDAIRLHMGIDP
ncbi:MAG: sigma-70 family RNA polymerase sigma factor [Pirellulaceae bacterium]